MYKTEEKDKNLRKEAKMAQNRVYVPPETPWQILILDFPEAKTVKICIKIP